MRIAEKRVEGLVGEAKTSRLATEIGELDPHLRVLAGRNDESSNFEDPLPDVDVALAALQAVGRSISADHKGSGEDSAPLHPGLLDHISTVDVASCSRFLVRDDLFELGEHLDADDGAAIKLVSRAHQS